MTFRTWAPTPATAAWVDRFWTKTGVEPSSQRILPDGCVDVIVQVGAQPRAEVVGTMTRAIVVPAGPVQAVAVRLRAGVARALFGTDIRELTDRHVGLEHWARDAEALVDAVLRGPSEATRVGALERWLLAISQRAARPDRAVLHAIDRLTAEPSLRVVALARELGCSRQHLARAFGRDVGIGPKEFARVVRLGRVVDRLAEGDPAWAALAVECGYYDQAHLAHDFADLVGTTPGRFAAGSILPIRPAASVPGSDAT